jgi:HK97 family phage major capsid protein
MNLRDKLKAKMQTALDRQKALIKAAEEANRELNAEETTEFEQLGLDFETAEKSLSQLEKTEAAETRMKARHVADKKDVTGNIERATEGGTPSNGGEQLTPAGFYGQRKLTAHERVGVVAWATAKNKHYPMQTPEQHLEEAGFQQIADECKAFKDFTRKTFLTTGASAGANTIVTPLSSEFIEFLQNESIFMRGSPVQVDLSYGKLDIAAGNAKTTAGYAAEGAATNATEATTRKVALSAKHLTAITAIGNYNIEVSPLAVAAILGDELAMTMTLAMDAAGLRGDGTGDNPAGILSLVHASHKTAATATSTTATYTQIDVDAKNMLTKAAASKVPIRRRRWLMCNRTFLYLSFLRDGNGNFVYPGLQLDTPVWHGRIPVLVSEQIPSNLGVGTNETELYLVDFGHVLMGIARSLTLKTSTEASYKNSGGTLVSAFAQDETVIRAMASHDFDLRHDKSCVVINEVKWGA